MSAAAAASLLSAVALSAGLGMSGCHAGSDTNSDVPGVPTRARILNALAATGAPALQVSSDRSGLQAAALPLAASTPYTLTTPGTITITAAGSDSPTNVVFPATAASLAAGRSYSLVLVGAVGAPSGSAAPRLLTIEDDAPPTAPTFTGQPAPAAAEAGTTAAVRVLNASPDAPALDLYDAAVPETPAEGGQPKPPARKPVVGATNVLFGNVSGYAPVASGSRILTVHEHAPASPPSAGTPPDPLSTPTLSRSQSLDLQAGRHYTLLIYGLQKPAPGQEGFDATLLPDD